MQAVRLAVEDIAIGTACTGCPSIEELVDRYVAAGGEFLVCPICVDAKGLRDAPMIKGATVGGTVPMWDWIGDEGATAFSY